MDVEMVDIDWKGLVYLVVVVLSYHLVVQMTQYWRIMVIVRNMRMMKG